MQIGSLGEYLGPSKMRMWSEEGSTMRNFVVCSPNNIVRMIKFKILGWAGHVAMQARGICRQDP